jgi:SNF2 family DNA or RNA helicase
MTKIVIGPAIKANGKYGVFVKFDYKPYIINRLGKIEEKYWHKRYKQWEFPTKHYQTVYNLFSQLGEVEVDKTYYERQKEIYYNKKLHQITADTFNFKTEPYLHQKECFDYGVSKNNWILGDEQGLGKTKEIIDIAVAKKQIYNYKHCLIICGINGLKWNWKEEIETHSNEKGYILGQRVGKFRKKIKIKSNKEKLEDLNNIENIKEYFIITNIESLRNTAIAQKLSELCLKGEINITALDEAHVCKNPQSSQTEGLMLVQSDCKIAMTGTPIMNSPLDAYIILRWLGYERNNFYLFKMYHCDLNSYCQIIGFKNLDKLHSQINRVMLRRLKKDVLDLPEKILINDYVELGKTQNDMYNKILNQLQSEKSKITSLAAFTRLRQITGYACILNKDSVESTKYERMQELIEESVSNNKKVIVFSNWTKIIEPAYELLQKYNPAIITGKFDDNQKMYQKNKFQNDDSCKVILGTIGAMGTGFTLTAGTVVIFLDEPWTESTKAQAIDRAHRIGTKDDIIVYTIMVQGSIDERVHNIVVDKGILADFLVDGIANEKKQEIIDYLLCG